VVAQDQPVHVRVGGARREVEIDPLRERSEVDHDDRKASTRRASLTRQRWDQRTVLRDATRIVTAVDHKHEVPVADFSTNNAIGQRSVPTVRSADQSASNSSGGQKERGQIS